MRTFSFSFVDICREIKVLIVVVGDLMIDLLQEIIKDILFVTLCKMLCGIFKGCLSDRMNFRNTKVKKEHERALTSLERFQNFHRIAMEELHVVIVKSTFACMLKSRISKGHLYRKDYNS